MLGKLRHSGVTFSTTSYDIIPTPFSFTLTRIWSLQNIVHSFMSISAFLSSQQLQDLQTNCISLIIFSFPTSTITSISQLVLMAHSMVCCFQVLQILCSSNGIFPNIRTSAEDSSEIEEVFEEEFDDGEMNMEETSISQKCTTDVRTHLALAMLGVDENFNSRTSSLDHSAGLELLHLDGRFRLPPSLVR